MAINERDVEEVLHDEGEGGAEETPGKLPEAPASVTVKGYYRGFSLFATTRDATVRFGPLLFNGMRAIDWMIEHNFKPSWNEETNHKNSQLPKSIIQKKEQENCGHSEWKEFSVKKSGQNQGRTFRKCVVCGKFEWLT